MSQYLTQKETERLLGRIKNPRDKAIFTIAYLYGIRASEIGLFKISDIDFKKNTIFIRRLKGSESGIWPLLPEAKRVLKQWLKEHPYPETDILFPSNRGGPIKRNTLHYLMRKYAAFLPAYKRHFHVLKHSAAMHLLEKTADITGVQQWLGHKSINSTMKYVHLLGMHRIKFAKKIVAI